MPTLAENKTVWDGSYSWEARGDEWSAQWGSVSSQWYSTLLPRIHGMLPAPTILEIACGYGRWTQFLRSFCDRLIAIDLSDECIEACKKRFASVSGIEYHVNDGKSLSMIEDDSVDFVFSFDSLVHADRSVIHAYLEQLPRILKDNGAAFLHHSNLGEYRSRYSLIRTIPKLEGLLITMGILDKFLHWRDPGVSGKEVAEIAAACGLSCISQEFVHWRTKRAMIDCMSVIVKRGSALERNNRIFRNPTFTAEADRATQLSSVYGFGSRTTLASRS